MADNIVRSILFPATAFVASTATTTQPANPLSNLSWRGGQFVIDVSAFSAGTITDLIIQQNVPDTAQATPWVTLYDFAALAIGAVGFFPLLLYPNTADAASWTKKINGNMPPALWRAQLTTSGFTGTAAVYFWPLP